MGSIMNILQQPGRGATTTLRSEAATLWSAVLGSLRGDSHACNLAYASNWPQHSTSLSAASFCTTSRSNTVTQRHRTTCHSSTAGACTRRYLHRATSAAPWLEQHLRALHSSTLTSPGKSTSFNFIPIDVILCCRIINSLKSLSYVKQNYLHCLQSKDFCRINTNVMKVSPNIL